MYSRKPSKIEIFMIQISSENHLKYLGCGHVCSKLLHFHKVYLFRGIYRGDKVCVKLCMYSHGKEIFCISISLTMTGK